MYSLNQTSDARTTEITGHWFQENAKNNGHLEENYLTDQGKADQWDRNIKNSH